MLLIRKFIVIPLFISCMLIAKGSSLGELATMALSHSPLLLGSAMQSKVSVDEKKDALTTFLPTVSLAYTPVISKLAVKNSKNTTTSGMMLKATETLSILNLNIYFVGESQINYDKEFYNYQRDQVLYKVAQDYWNVVIQKKLIQQASQLLKQLEKQYSYIRQNYKNGIEKLQNVLSFQTVVLRQKESIESMKQILIIERSQLAEDVGVQESITVDNVVALQNNSVLKNIKNLDIKNMATYKLYQLQSKIGDSKVRSAESDALWPTLDLALMGGYGNTGVDSLFSTSMYANYNASLTLNWTLFNWGKNWRAATLERSKNAVILYQRQQDVVSDYQHILAFSDKTKSDFLNMKYSTDYYNVAKRSYNLVLDQYHRGLSTYLDLSNSITSYINAESQFLNQQNVLQQDLLEYHYYKGDMNGFVFKPKS